jgi:glyoxalase family protein
MASATIPGIHHITAIASEPQRNLGFYTDVLGLRLVKLTVNFDDPGTYHFYFADGEGSPGTILTFFPWPGARRGSVGNGQVSAVAFAVPLDSFPFWRERLNDRGVATEDAGMRFGDGVLRFADPDGLPLELIATSTAFPAHAWKTGPVPAPRAICGFQGATLAEKSLEETAALLQDSMGLRFLAAEDNRSRYVAGSSGAGSTVDVVCEPSRATGSLGAGTVHHIAWRTPDDGQQKIWREALMNAGYRVTAIMDRCYFHSIYFNEPGGVLFEIATDPPGFLVDEPKEHLGERLMLPKWLEPKRSAIESALPALVLPRRAVSDIQL